MISATETKNNKAFYNTEIPADWEVKELGEIGELKNGINKEKEDFGFGFPMVNLMDVFGISKVFKNNFNLGLVNANERDIKEYSLIKGDVLFIRSSVKPQGVGLTTVICDDLENTTYCGFIIRFRDKGYLDLEYKAHCFFEVGFRRRLLNKSTISANTNINQGALNSLKIPLPPLPEQKAIAQVLSTADAAIHSTEKLIAQKELRKKWLMQQLLTGKKRLKGFIGEWKEKKLEYFIKDYKQKPTNENNFEVLTSAKAGLMLQTDYYGDNRITNRVDADYNVIPPNYLTYRSRSDDGLFTFNKNDLGITGLISGYYPVFTIKNGDKNFILMYMNYYRQKLTKYAIGTSQLVLAMNALKEAKFHLPKEEEQTAIAQVLQAADKEISLLKAKAEKLREQKKWLIQQLLTGKKRLSV